MIFGVFTWILIQDPDDPLCRLVSFGERGAHDRDKSKEIISTTLPSDFGTPGYSTGRTKQIAAHIKYLSEGVDDLAWLFEYWLQPSWGFRQYLWAHRDKDIETARQVVASLPGAALIRIVEYLLGSYWDRYLGWPDILANREGEFLFVEVKSSSDRFFSGTKALDEGEFQEPRPSVRSSQTASNFETGRLAAEFLTAVSLAALAVGTFLKLQFPDSL